MFITKFPPFEHICPSDVLLFIPKHQKKELKGQATGPSIYICTSWAALAACRARALHDPTQGPGHWAAPQGATRAPSSVQRAVITSVVAISAVAGVKRKMKFLCKIPCSWLYLFFSFCNCRISACLKHAWSVIFQGKYLKKAASRLLICCNFSFKEN